jgi:hypothetical protein
MYVRVIDGSVHSKALLRNAWERLTQTLAEHEGFLGAAGGVSAESRFLGVLRFAEEAAALAAMPSPGPELWYEQLITFIHDIEVRDTDDAEVLIPGGTGAAGFVQFVVGRTSDRQRMRTLKRGMQEMIRVQRPEVLGAIVAWHPDDRFTETVYFASEQAARDGEGREFPGGMASLLGDILQVVPELDFVDVRDPWLLDAAAE